MRLIFSTYFIESMWWTLIREAMKKKKNISKKYVYMIKWTCFDLTLNDSMYLESWNLGHVNGSINKILVEDIFAKPIWKNWKVYEFIFLAKLINCTKDQNLGRFRTILFNLKKCLKVDWNIQSKHSNYSLFGNKRTPQSSMDSSHISR